MHRMIALAVFLTGLASLATRAQVLDYAEVALDWRRNNYAYAELTLSSDRWSRESLETISIELLVELAEYEFVQVLIYDGVRKWGPPGLPSHTYGTFAKWLAIRRKYCPSPIRYAELIKIGDNAAVRYRGDDGQEVRIVLSGDDPLVLTVDGERVELVLVKGLAAEHPRRLTALLMTPADLERGFGERVLEVVQSLLPRPTYIVVRNDYWFMKTPYCFPFFRRGEPPTEEEWNRTVSLSCSEIVRVQCYVGREARIF